MNTLECIYKENFHLDVEVISKCNFRCPYCYNAHILDDFKYLKVDYIFKVIEEFHKYHKIVDINVLGGEPSLYPYLKDLLDKCYKTDYITRITIFTNGSYKLVNKINFDDKLNISFSIHPTEINDYNKLLMNIKECSKLCKVHAQVNNFKIDDKCKMFIQDLKKHKIDIEYNDIYNPETAKQITFTDDKRFRFNDELLSFKEISNRGLNKLKGCKCYINEFSLLTNKSIYHECIGHINFNDIGKINKYTLCKFDKCNNSCLLSFKKEF